MREKPDCRGRLRTGPDGSYGYRAVVPIPYPIPGDVSAPILLRDEFDSILISFTPVQGPVGDMLVALGRHNMRPNHLHIMIQAPGFRKLVTAFYPEGDMYLASDAVFGVKKSLIVVSHDLH